MLGAKHKLDFDMHLLGFTWLLRFSAAATGNGTACTRKLSVEEGRKVQNAESRWREDSSQPCDTIGTIVTKWSTLSLDIASLRPGGIAKPKNNFHHQLGFRYINLVPVVPGPGATHSPGHLALTERTESCELRLFSIISDYNNTDVWLQVGIPG